MRDSNPINRYGDVLIGNGGHGSDIASQRIDELDQAALELIQNRVAAGDGPQVLDAGCGRCGHSNRMAAAGASVHAVDLQDFCSDAEGAVEFFQQDLHQFLKKSSGGYGLIYCQRTLHYFPFAEAKALLWQMYVRLEPEGYLLVSASGLESELGEGYPHRNNDLRSRYAPLSEVMQRKHAIREPVCLYTLDELQQTVNDVGFTVRSGFRSNFGNVKCIAQRRR